MRTATTLLLLGVLLGLGSGPGTGVAFASPSPSSSSPAAAHTVVPYDARPAPARAGSSSVGTGHARSLASNFKYDRHGKSSTLFWIVAGVVVVGGLAYNIVRYRRRKGQDTSDN